MHCLVFTTIYERLTIHKSRRQANHVLHDFYICAACIQQLAAARIESHCIWLYTSAACIFQNRWWAECILKIWKIKNPSQCYSWQYIWCYQPTSGRRIHAHMCCALYIFIFAQSRGGHTHTQPHSVMPSPGKMKWVCRFRRHQMQNKNKKKLAYWNGRRFSSADFCYDCVQYLSSYNKILFIEWLMHPLPMSPPSSPLRCFGAAGKCADTRVPHGGGFCRRMSFCFIFRSMFFLPFGSFCRREAIIKVLDPTSSSMLPFSEPQSIDYSHRSWMMPVRENDGAEHCSTPVFPIFNTFLDESSIEPMESRGEIQPIHFMLTFRRAIALVVKLKNANDHRKFFFAGSTQNYAFHQNQIKCPTEFFI